MSKMPVDNSLNHKAHSVMCELAGLSDVLDGLQACGERPPLERLHKWVERLHHELDDAILEDLKARGVQ